MVPKVRAAGVGSGSGGESIVQKLEPAPSSGPGPDAASAELPSTVPVDVALELPEHVDDASRILLAGAVSHELRTTLALIAGYGESLLHLSLDDETRRRYLERILAATDTLTGFADQILELSVSGQGGPALKRRPVAVRWLVERLVREVAQEAATATIRYQSPEHLPLVEVDPSWIVHVLRNLVANALKHGTGGAGVVTIRARHVDTFVVVSVCDDGLGFQSDERSLVFDAHYQGRRARAEGVDGAGLGLYLCRELVEAHGGRIWVDATTEGGSVSFSVPCYQAVRAVNEPLASGLKAVLAAGG